MARRRRLPTADPTATRILRWAGVALIVLAAALSGREVLVVATGTRAAGTIVHVEDDNDTRRDGYTVDVELAAPGPRTIRLRRDARDSRGMRTLRVGERVDLRYPAGDPERAVLWDSRAPWTGALLAASVGALFVAVSLRMDHERRAGTEARAARARG